MLGNGIFNRDGDIWKAHRAMARPFFQRERVTDFKNFETHTKEALTALDALQHGKEKEPVLFDAQDLFARYTIDSAATFVRTSVPNFSK